MNVYHKVLTKIYEMTGGRDSVDVDLAALTKKEGFYSNISAISGQLMVEGWIVEGPKTNIVRITHWGSTEAKRVLSASPDKVNEISKETNRLVTDGKEFVIMLEEFTERPETAGLDRIEKRISELAARCKKIREYL
jgi:hypothetical protein